MAERRGRTCDAGIADQDVELAMALVQRGAEPGDAVDIAQAERHQRGAAAVFADVVIEFFQAALGARQRHDVRALPGKRACDGVTDAARGAGDESDAGGEGEGHGVGSIDRRPRERGDPYAVSAMVTESRNCLRVASTKSRWLWVPAFAGTTASSPPPAATIALAAA